MDNNEIFMRVLLNDKIKLEPKYMSKNYKQELLRRLKDKVEGKCTRHGYIRKNSIEIYKVTPGIVELISLNGGIQYDIYFHAEVCNPMLGTIVKAKVMNINKFGILAEAGYNDPDTNEFLNILEIIIAKNSVNIVSDVNLNDIKIGNEVRVEIMGKKYELNDKQISIVGRVVADSKSRGIAIVGGETAEGDLAGEDEEYEEEIEDEEEEAADEEAEDEEGDDFEGDEEEVDEEEVEEVDEIDGKSSKAGGDLFSDEEDGFFEDDEDGFFEDDDGGEDDEDAD